MKFQSCVLAVTAAFTFSWGAAAQTVQPTDFIDVFEKLSGKHPGYRKAHAAGVCVSAQFQPNTQSTSFSNAPLLSSGPLPAIMRFSLGGGHPSADERAPGTRGMGLQITLPNGTRHIFTGNNFPVFAGKDPQTFLGLLQSMLPDENGQRNPQKTLDYIKANPSVQANVQWNQQAKTPASYANTEFYGLHTFFYKGSDAKVKFRWQLTPDLGVETLDKGQAEALATPFLAGQLSQQLQQGEVAFTLYAVIGQENDAEDDPSQQWPEERERIALGKVILESTGGDSCVSLNFDPNVLSPGFEPSQDPVLRMRSLAYAISFGKRLSGQ